MPRPKQSFEKKAKHWRDVFRQFEQANQSIRQFCIERGIHEASFYKWRKTLKRHDSYSSPPPFVPIRVQPQVEKPGDTSVFELVMPDGSTIRVPVDFDADGLRRLLALLQESSC